MDAPSAGTVVSVRFPFSDLSESKLRSAGVLAFAGRDDFILCQITSRPYSDSKAVRLEQEDFAAGSLQRTSYARYTKLFTANLALIAEIVGVLQPATHRKIANGLIELLRVSP